MVTQKSELLLIWRIFLEGNSFLAAKRVPTETDGWVMWISKSTLNMVGQEVGEGTGWAMSETDGGPCSQGLQDRP